MEMNLADLMGQFGSDDKCRDYLESLRWPDGVECPKCESKSISRISTRKQFDCNSCRNRFSVKADTVLQDSKLPLWKWFAAVYLMCESKKGISALQVKRMLKIGSYETAWHLCHRIRSAMEDVGAEPLTGTVEADETWVGGVKRDDGSFQGLPSKRRQHRALHRYDNKSLILGAVERHGEVRLRVAPDASGGTVKGFLREVLGDDTEAIYTDAHRSYRGIGDADTIHEWVNHHRDEWVRGDVHTQTIESVWSLFKRSIIGSYHHMSVKHLPSYLDEMEWRYNNRNNEFLFRDTILALVKADALTYQKLVAS